jgi:CMP-2-keto-3-deoxyoctulosonic acid synthetase|tara:strand:+ start:154 stop:549 length:396 start_codon:yes stop_codon:yes gene_type:complete
MNTNIVVVIPARYASSRFPGKPLAPLVGATGIAKSLIERSWNTAMQVDGVSAVYVATDDESNAASTLQLVLEETSVVDMMTEGGIRLSPDILASKALNILQTNQISVAFVIKENRPIGLVSLLQLLQQGVA